MTREVGTARALVSDEGSPSSRLRELRPAVFLDRDGVLCRTSVIAGKSYAVRRLEDFRLFPGTTLALAKLREAGYRLVVVTNQPDIGNGLVAPEVVEAMHERLRQRIAPDAIEMCPHRQGEGCSCRKPKPGMIFAAARRLGIDLAMSALVGDRWSDVVAGQEAGCYTVLIDRGYSEVRRAVPHCAVRTLPAAVDAILRWKSQTVSERRRGDNAKR